MMLDMKHHINIKKLYKWYAHQKENYITKQQIMRDDNIKLLWEKFINDEKYKIYFMSLINRWKQYLNNVIEYININNKLPSSTDKLQNIARLGIWLSSQRKSFKNKLYIMKNDDIKLIWIEFTEKYKEYFIGNINKWISMLNNVINYIEKEQKMPSCHSKDNNIKKMAIWVLKQKISFIKNIYIMKNDNIRNLWIDFINNEKYSNYLLTYDDRWLHNLNLVKLYIDKEYKIPSTEDENKHIKYIGKWLSDQSGNFDKQIKI